jgi:AcrR family transcriptional regulator
MRPSVEEERREQLIAAAARVIARSGYDAATVRDVAREAGVSTGVIAYYFDGKDDLFAHVLRTASRAFRARLERARAGAETPRERLLALAGTTRPPMTSARAHAPDRLLGAGGARPALAGDGAPCTTAGGASGRRARGQRPRVSQRRRPRGVARGSPRYSRRSRHARAAAASPAEDSTLRSAHRRARAACRGLRNTAGRHATDPAAVGRGSP